ncbi:Zinc finger C2H2-type/integrase DNA-binding domain [Penicillium roqueforti FM164]|uniref:Zinc finger C2H2-type/integrase DNA-binding domain n=1 Tax=Penicillium roqueforti (strain FM164) TaxID=1365484 RepID=W6QNQ5_PENRF|nr:Zinc finger C2H2-type/integrase DNA-binding domain [Penicillium roqueforti FM164]
MFREHHKHPPLPWLSQPLQEIDIQDGGPKLSEIKPSTLATTPFYHGDLHVLPSRPDQNHSLWRLDNFHTISPQNEYQVENEIVQVYHCSLGCHHHTPMPLRDRGMPNVYLSQQTAHPPELTSILCLPQLRLCESRRLESTPACNVVPGAEISIIQTINPALLFPTASTTTSESLNFTARQGAALEVCSIPSGTGDSSTWFLGQPQKHSEILYDTTNYIKDHSLLGCHAYRRQPGHNLDVEDQECDMHERKFQCNIIGCRMGFKRQDHLERHTRGHLKEKPYVCWVPGCHRTFSRRDNLKVHCTKTHTRRGGRNRYVATLDETSPHYDPEFRGQLSPDGRPLRFLAPINLVPEAKPQQL